MTIFLFFIFAITIFGIMLVLSVINGITSFLFGKSNTSSNYRSHGRKQEYNSPENTSKAYKKIFSKDEGEYVKYEEIKE
ncbi:DUF4834 family protein [Dysgonomonas sp.]|nr:DUF4834 family protein [Prevotella sp.]